MSYIEFIGTIAGLICVWLAAKSNILTWPIGLINIVCFFIIFYQINLYSDTILQVYFFFMSIYGWIYWKKNDPKSEMVSSLTQNSRWIYLIISIISILGLGFLMKNIHTLLPTAFPEAAAFPFPDAFTTVLSIIATILMAQKKWESWVLWIIVDIVCVFLYYLKGIKFISLEYFIFLGIASYGLYSWLKLYNNEKRNGSGQIHSTA